MAFVSDTFTDTDTTALQSHTGETGATWTAHPSLVLNSTISGNRLAPPSSVDTSAYYASGAPSAAEYDVQADFIRYATLSGSVDGGITGRMNISATTFYLVYYGNYGGGLFSLTKAVAGTFTELATYTQALTQGQAYAVKLEIRTAAKKVYINGVERISSTDNAVTAAGKAGVRCYGSGSWLRLDNFSAQDLAAAPVWPLPGQIVLQAVNRAATY